MLTSYGQDLVNFEQLDRVIAPKFKEQLIKSYEAKFGNKTVFTDLEAYTKIPSLFGKNLSLTTGVGFFKYVNKSSRPVRFVFKCKEFKGLKFIKPETYPHQAIVEP